MHGLLFSNDFLAEGIKQTRGWMESESEFIQFREIIRDIFSDLSSATALNEAQTEDEIILPVMRALGWGEFIRQPNTSGRGRHDVPDFLFFADVDAKRAARRESRDDRRYRHGKLVVEAKKWLRPLDRGDNSDPLDSGTPSNQVLRYLSRVEVASDGAVRWGVLTNGALWRLYWQDARSRSEEFLQFDLADLASVAGVNAGLFEAANDTEKVHYLRAFFLLFRREAFLPQAGDAEGRDFHAIALEEGRNWETKVSQDLGERVFDELFPQLAAAIARNLRDEPRPLSREALEHIHRATLILLYRLLFVLYAEDRTLLPVNDGRYDDYSLRKLRHDIALRREANDAFSATATRIWGHLRDLFRAIDQGDASIGLPPYNGGLFHESPGDVLARTELRDAELAPLIDGLSRRPDISGRGFINYRDLAVQHLGSIYERLLEQQLEESAGGELRVRPSTFARKNSGSYYTHDDLVKLILRETLDPLAGERIAAFDARLAELKHNRGGHAPEQLAIQLAEFDPAEALLSLKVCDPAMGSGHFLVSLVDDLADRVLEQLAHAEASANEAGIAHYRSPITADIERLRASILTRAAQSGWTVDQAMLDDRHLVRRMILKRVVHGVDKNRMAVELAKLALWLHTFTVGAPLSFLDHHLRCGDSLYGERITTIRRDLGQMGHLFNDSQMAGLLGAAQTLGEINAINDIDLSEVERSRQLMDNAHGMLEGLKRVFDLWQALRWIAPLNAPRDQRGEKHQAATELLSSRYRLTLMELLHGEGRVHSDDPRVDEQVNALLDECRALAKEEGFFHWELAFPGVWPANGAAGGFDAIIGNPPWDRMKLQEVEWFAERRPEIALQPRAADRKRMIAGLQRANDPLAAEYALAARRAEDAARIARDCGEYPLLSGGDINLYSLFVERASSIVQARGVVGLLTPSGIAGDKGAAKFFKSISTSGRLGALFDFENKKVFFPDIHASFKFCSLIFGGVARQFGKARCAFYLHAVDELKPMPWPDDASERERKLGTRLIELDAADFSVVNPNTGTAPIFRNALDAELTTRIFRNHPVLVRRHMETRVEGRNRRPVEVEITEPLYPVRYCTMFHMTNDSGLFKRRNELEAEGWYPVAGSRWRRGNEEMLPLYVGRMIYHYDHRASSVTINEENLHNAAASAVVDDEQKNDPNFVPEPQYWISRFEERIVALPGWFIGFRDITNGTNERTFISAVVPTSATNNKLPLLIPDDISRDEYARLAPYLMANLNSMALDYTARRKIQGTNLNWYIVEQLPLIDRERYADMLGSGTVGDLVHREVMRLSYTANDLAAFAHDLGFDGAPFAWDPEDRRHRMARLDALYFRLYDLDRDDAAYIMDTFPIVREQDERAFGRYRTKELVLGYMNALAAGDTETVLAI